MAQQNGVLTPDPPQQAPKSPDTVASPKRKRSGDESAEVPALNSAARPLQTVLEEIVAVLENHDTQPSILKLPITSATTRSDSGESEPKRAKLTSSSSSASIADLVRQHSYSSLQTFLEDVETATDSVLESLEETQSDHVTKSTAPTKPLQIAYAFKKMATTLVLREGVRSTHKPPKTLPAQDADTNGVSTPAVVTEDPILESRTVLTLYGTAQGPKQLFSSLQQPVSVPPNGTRATSGLDTSVKVILPLREAGLPNFLSTTDVYPLPEDEDTKPKTFGDLFPAPSHIPQLSPPKPAKPQTAKGNTVTFVPQDPLAELPNKSSRHYSNQRLRTGHWLGYGGVNLPKDPTSPTAKQKSRQRALSTGEVQPAPSGAALEAVRQAKEDALFRSVFSSFAPSRDDSMAIVPAELKKSIWWEKTGEKRFQETFPIDPALLGLDESSTTQAQSAEDEVESFKEVVEHFEPIENDPFKSFRKSEDEKTTDDLLQEISEMIETLASYQRIRNSSLATNPRTPVLQNSALASLAGSPSSPSTEEVDLYQMLKAQLALIIAQLPPYAVAKLNGDQLDELNISRTLIIEAEDHKGVLEEDQLSRRPAMPLPAAPPPMPRMSSSGTPAHVGYASSGAHYPRTTPAHTGSARPVQTPQTYFPQQQSAHRPSMQYQRSSSGHAQSYPTPAPSYNGTTARPSYGSTQYAQQPPRANSFAQPTGGQFSSQRPPAPTGNYNNAATAQFYQSSPQPQPHRYGPQTASNGYVQRNQAPTTYNYNAGTTARTASPLKSMPAVGANPPHSSRASYGASMSSGAMRSTYYPQGAANPVTYATPSTPSPSNVGSYNALAPNHQQMVNDRQQAQAVAQSQARLAAQNNIHRNGSGTPQPPASQYGGQPPSAGAPMPT
ncbi:hypothetical protein M011DRAFT_415103 [Sporormia fimetaria CBS 119925]|uniref:Uncharacterized protein n=1 Tax=Sporormia fimetaria CBS 119925 TaxID=1340428 RepID=A0A6A6VN38_9PLEO|nr:hypothetical protein M011DRAFT_415103 [Sporormia fimetaria CBS 119925]